MSPVACVDIVQQHLETVGDRFSCSERDGRIWIVSPYLYPNGDLVEVAVRELSTGEALVSDLGETLRFLSGQGFDPRTTSKGEYLIDEIAKQHNVSVERGMITKRVPVGAAGTALQDVLLAALAISHLLYLSRTYRPATFHEEVAHLLEGAALRFIPRHEEIGQVTQKKYSIDFYIQGSRREALIQALSPTTKQGSIPMVNATFRLWSDVPNGRTRTTLVDDRAVEWRHEDLVLLEGVSDVYKWTDRERFQKELSEAVGAA